MKQKIYFDNGATAALAPGVLDAMMPYYKTYYGNPAGIYEFSRVCRDAMELSRKRIAALIHCSPEEIYITSGGTESDNWAIKGCAEANAEKGRHIITTVIEHHAVLNTCHYLETRGFDVTYLPVDHSGHIDLYQLEQAIREDTTLISIQYANNEIGTIQPVREIGRIAKKHGVLFHSDGVQACGHVPVFVHSSGIDLFSASAHKFGGPKGIGFLYVRKGTPISPFMHGGMQENGMRAGTGNVPCAVGMGAAADYALRHLQWSVKRTSMLRSYMLQTVQRHVPGVVLNGHETMRLPGNVNFSFPGAEGDAVVKMLDREGICCSTGSACNAGFKTPSHVLQAIGLPEELLYGTVRFTISSANTTEEIDYLAAALDKILPMIEGNRL